MNIQKEIQISEHQPVKFCADSDLYELYKALIQRWKLNSAREGAFAASVFYNLGRVHGIRQERARRASRREDSDHE